MKKIKIIIILSIFLYTMSANLRNEKAELSFSSEKGTTLDKQFIMESIFTGKPTMMKTNFNFEGQTEEKKSQEISPVLEDKFKQDFNKIDWSKLETPQIVPSRGQPIKDQFKEAEKQQQTRGAYGNEYPKHRAYNDENAFTVFDNNFNKIEESLLNDFQSAIDSGIGAFSDHKLENVQDFNKGKANLQEFTGNYISRAPLINKYTDTNRR